MLLLAQHLLQHSRSTAAVHHLHAQLEPCARIPRCNLRHDWYALAHKSRPVVTLQSRPRAHEAAARSSGAVKAIWQTAKSRSGVATLVGCFHDSWDRHNPGWEHAVLDDADMFAVMSDRYDEGFMQKFRDLPLGVMRADVFRCAAADPHELQQAFGSASVAF